MLAIAESILPIFLLIVAGNLVSRTPLIAPAAWGGLEQLGFWFLYPVLLFTTILGADFSALELNSLLLTLIISIAALSLLVALVWPVSRKTGLIARSEYSSVFQTSIRWNGFMAFAIAQKLFPPEGLAFVALMMAAIIIPINLQSIYVLARFSDRGADFGAVMVRIVTNPLILATGLALILRAAPFGLYEPVALALDMIGRAALGMGLIVIGVGLRPADLVSTRAAIWIPVVLKLLVFPAITIAMALVFGINGPELAYLALCAAVPTAMNGFLLARQMGGDAELYAAIATMQTMISFFSISLVLTIVAYMTAG